jgi:hypothetical protein
VDVCRPHSATSGVHKKHPTCFVSFNPNDQHYLGIRVPKITLRRMNDAPSHHVADASMYEATLRKLTRAKLQKLAKVCVAFFSECYRK